MVLQGWAMPWTRMDGDGARVRALPTCATSLCFGSGQAISFPIMEVACLISVAVAMNVRAAGNLVLVNRKAPPKLLQRKNKLFLQKRKRKKAPPDPLGQKRHQKPSSEGRLFCFQEIFFSPCHIKRDFTILKY